MSSVRTHTRRVNGRAVTVHNHTRAGRGGSADSRRQRGPLLQPRRAGRNLRRAWRAARRHKKATAIGFLALCGAELAAWLASSIIGIALTVIAVLALGLGMAALTSTGIRRPE
jgi:hypothetical protein